ncbi:SAM dependent carboxyl methyltransferase [Hirsutella rhossiliensis]|uniref:SAM dependent carboxyl methyltransferase domain-containing protein n=1 Tax=Hirsutella rhossiliensis TaxID=111463 RepID=A0A9P8SEV2_9HYPO|nr:SAM dependent carboxyl methyltransferase domain-containing protein [Hirsutella rhossiliensis]KAH0959419.1 SAM dependent carboxyl methyltransferase domain-containing protein [Hirsutella rhossiliensis]
MPAAQLAVDDAVLVNDVPMQGKGSYRSHAALQHEAMLKTLPLLQRAAREAAASGDGLPSGSDQQFTIVEYGSAHGNNSIEPLEAMLPLTQSDQVQLLLSDRPENDFNTLSATVSAWADALDPARFPSSVFLGLIPRSFYRPLVPPRSVNLGFSLCCLHHLDRLPAAAHDDEMKRLCRAQAHDDLCLFLRLRASEVVRGGSLVLTFVGRDASGRDNYAGPVDACRKAMVQMIEDGVIPASVAAAFRIPTYDRSLDDVWGCLDELRGVWEAREVQADAVLHPAIKDLARHTRHGEDNAASQQYSDVVIDWLMAVCSGYFLKAVRVGGADDAYTEAGASQLLSEWARRTKRIFLKDHRDEPVFCSFIRMLLHRL